LNLFELFAVLLSAGLLGGYYVWLALELRRQPLRTVIGYAAIKRREWVRSVMAERRDILAVQTLRNWTMAASFLATTAILIASGTLHFLTAISERTALLHAINFFGSSSQTLITLKLFAIVATLLAAFFNFAVAVRYYNHVAIDINAPPPEPGEGDLAAVQGLMDRGSWHYTFGMRSFYLVVPLALWLFGGLWLLLGSAVLCVGLYHMDHLD
jgi:uncharacterized membrane protein